MKSVIDFCIAVKRLHARLTGPVCLKQGANLRALKQQ